MAAKHLLAVCLVLIAVLAGCGGSDDPGRSDGPAGGERYEPEPITPAQAERFAEVELPPGADEVEATGLPGPMDDSVAISFTVARSEVDELRSILTEPLEEGRLTVPDSAELGWEIEDSERYLGASDLVDGVGRRVLVDLDVSGRPVVYLLAGTVS